MSIDDKLYPKGLLGPIKPVRSTLAKQFLVAPFSVLDTRVHKSGKWWQKRKKAWIALGIKGEVGRSRIRPHGKDVRSVECSGMGPSYRQEKNRIQKRDAWLCTDKSGGSIFDPVLCELAYRWFCPPSGQVLDPFAGGSVRGIVAHELGFRYWGCDLRQEQIDANLEQAVAICPQRPPAWSCGDALDLVPKAPLADLVFSCPPYGDLERYSDDPRDLSTMGFREFMSTLKKIISLCWDRLQNDRFACFVVSEFRDKQGHYHNFVGNVIRAFQAAGFHYYNEMILVTAVGSLPIRISKQFKSGRKIGKTHQNVLVFVKGDAKKATEVIEGEK